MNEFETPEPELVLEAQLKAQFEAGWDLLKLLRREFAMESNVERVVAGPEWGECTAGGRTIWAYGEVISGWILKPLALVLKSGPTYRAQRTHEGVRSNDIIGRYDSLDDAFTAAEAAIARTS
jgi:hypothetical protein